MPPSRHSFLPWVLVIVCMLAFPRGISAQGVATPANPASAATDVPVYRGNVGRTGSMPGPGPTSTPTQLWRFQANGGINTSPAIVAGVLYAGSDDGVMHALDAVTGEERWSFVTDGPAGFPTIAGDVLYMGSGDGNLYALDTGTGQEAWHVAIGARVGSPLVVDETIYAAAENGLLVALDAASGQEQWRQQMPEGVLRGPSYADGLLFFGNEDGHDYALDAVTGEVRWSFDLGFETGLTPAVVDGVVYLGARTGDTTGAQIAVDAPTGKELWRFQTPKRTAMTNATIAGGMDYVGDYVDGTIWAIDVATGTEVWHAETDGTGVTAAPSIAAGVVYYATHGGEVGGIDAATGEKRWTFEVDSQTEFSAIVSNGALYLGTTFGGVYAIGGTGQLGTPSASPAGVSSETGSSLATFVWQAGADEGILGQPEDIAVAPDGSIWVLASGGVNQLQHFDRDGTLIENLSDEESFSAPQADLRAIAFADDGTIYLADHGTSRMLKLAPDGAFLTAWGSRGDGDDQFRQMSDIVIDSQGNVYVIDVVLNRVVKFDADGTWLGTIISAGNGDGQLESTARLGIDANDRLYIPDGSHVEVFAADGTLLRTIGDGDHGVVVDAAVDADGRVFVSDQLTSEVKIYDPSGALLGSWGGFGGDPGMFREVDALALDGGGNIYVIDYTSRRIQAFALAFPDVAGPQPGATPGASPAASPVAAKPAELVWSITEWPQPLFAGQLSVAPDGHVWVSDGERSTFKIFAPDGSFVEEWGTPGKGDGEFHFLGHDGDPFGDIAWAPDGTFYVADVGNQRIQHFDRDRSFLDAWGEFGGGDGQFISPISIAVDAEGNVFVDDDKRNDVQKFTADGTFVIKFGGIGSGPGQLDFQGFLALDGDGNVWVADSSHHRVEVWDNDGTFLRSVGEDGSLDYPLAVAFDNAGRLYVVEGEKSQVVMFDTQGQILASWSVPRIGDGQAPEVPFDVAVDGQGSVYVGTFTDDSDQLPGSIQKFRLMPPLAIQAGSEP